MGKLNNSQMERERAVYDYLDALESGDIDSIIAILNQAVYDAPLDQMVAEAHQAFFQEEAVQQAEVADLETQTELPVIMPSRPRTEKRNQPKRRMPVWAQTLAAVLIVGALVGSFMAVMTARLGSNSLAGPGKGTPAATPSSQCYPLKQFDAQNNGATWNSLNSLSGVSIVSENDAWAVGSSFSTSLTGPTVSATFIEHWNGRAWRIMASPNSTEQNSVLNQVAAVSANDVWAVGYSWQPNNPSNQGAPLTHHTLIEHWDGKSWQVVPSPNGPAGNGMLNGLTALAWNNIWAVGSSADTRGQIHPFTEHWDGQSWQVVALQGSNVPIIGGLLQSVAATSPNDIWAVGFGSYPNALQPRGLVEHWNGTQWQSVAAPQSNALFLNSVSALSPGDVWAAGYDAKERPVVVHWDGKQWSNVALPSDVAGQNADLAITAVSANNVWAVGGSTLVGMDQQAQMLLLHWDGKTWQQIGLPSLQLPGSLSSTRGDAIAISDGQMWIVGSAQGGSASLILGQHTC